MKAFVVSDIHGMYQPFELILANWNTDDHLVILGDLIDRGQDSLKVVQKVMQLKEQYGDKVIVLKGNHEDMLEVFIEAPKSNGDWYFNNGGREAIYSFLEYINDDVLFSKSYIGLAHLMKQHKKDELEFLRQAKYYHQFGKVLFTHAGFQSLHSDWTKTRNVDYLWIRDHYKHKNETGLINVFGHTPTQLINSDKSNNVWISEDKSYIGIDGASCFGGQINAILIDDEGNILETYKALCSRKGE